MNFSPVVNNTLMEGTVSQIFYTGPSFYLYDKKRGTFYNCFFDI